MVYRTHLRWARIAVATLLCWALRAGAQVQATDDVVLSLNGTVSSGYSGSYSSNGPSSHGVVIGGVGDLSGSYYNPQFLSFDLSPFYNQSRNSATSNSINDSSGLTARANIFAGSHFPGYVNFSRIYNSESNYLVPGISTFKTNGNSQTLGVSWNFNVKNLPSLSVGYQQGNNDNSLYGARSDSISNFHSLFGNANYTIDGFHFNGGVHHSTGSSEFPQIVAGQPIEKTASDTTTYTFSLNRGITWDGNTWVNLTRNSAGYDTPGFSSSQTADIVSGGVTLKPSDKLSTQFSADYNDSLAGTLYQLVNSSGVLAPVSIPAGTSHSWGLFGQAQYSILSGLFVAGSISHREQLFRGATYDSTSYSGSVSFGHRFLGGQFNSSATVTENRLATQDESMLSLLSTASYIRQIGAWNVSGSFNYSENVQTILLAYTSSGYGYSGSVSRRLRRLNWTASASGSRTLQTQETGTSNFSQSYATGLSGRWLGGSAGYSQSSGTGLFSAAGITQLPPGIPPGFLPSSVLFAGKTYSVGLGSTPIRGLAVNGNWVRSINTTENALVSSNNKSEQVNGYLVYRFRQMYFNAGYTRLFQGFSASGLAAVNVSSYYFSISRWFKFF